MKYEGGRHCILSSPVTMRCRGWRFCAINADEEENERGRERERKREREGEGKRERREPSTKPKNEIMARTFALVACLVALIAQASAFMISPGAIGAQRQGAAMSGFTGQSPVCQRDTTTDRSTLRMMVSRAYDRSRSD